VCAGSRVVVGRVLVECDAEISVLEGHTIGRLLRLPNATCICIEIFLKPKKKQHGDFFLYKKI
jgi:hypothetical protein